MPTTWNPADKIASLTLSNGNLTVTSTALTDAAVRAVASATTGKFYWEVTFNTIVDASEAGTGVIPLSTILTSVGIGNTGAGGCSASGGIFVNGAFIGVNSAIAAGGTMGIAFDADAHLIWFRPGAAGQWNASGTANPATGTGGANLGAAGVALYPYFRATKSGEVITANFGPTGFVGAVPAGFTAGFGPTFTTWSPTDKTANITLSGTNSRVATSTTAAFGGVRTIDRQITGKFYWEITATTFGSGSSGIGVATFGGSLTNGVHQPGISAGTCGVRNNGILYVDGLPSGVSFGAITSGTVVCFAVDAGAKLIWVRLGAAGNWNASAGANPATGVGGVTHFSAAFPIYPAFWNGNINEVATANFGDAAFVGAVPAGFTSGFTSGATPANNMLATQAAIEDWRVPANPDMQVTQVAIEDWRVPIPDAQVTQVAAEHWYSANPDIQVTQVLLEQWISVQIFVRNTSTGTSNSSTSTTINLPAGVQVGDVLIIAYEQASTMGASPTITPPAGWTTIINAKGILVCWRAFQAGDPTTGITATSTLSNWWESICIAYAGLDTTNPIDAQVSNFRYCSGSTFSAIPQHGRAPSLCPNFMGSQLLCVFAYNATAGTAIGLPAGLTDQVSTAVGPNLRMCDMPLIDGTPTRAFDAAISGGRSLYYFGMQIALKALGAAPATPLAPARPQLVGTYNDNSTSTTFSLPLANLNVQNGDMVVLAFASPGGTPTTVPVGYTAQSTQPGAQIYTHLWQTGDTTAPTFVLTGGWVALAVSLVRQVGVSAVPITIDKIATATNTGNPATTLIGTQTPTYINELLLVLLGSVQTPGGTWSTITGAPTDEVIINGGPGLRWGWISPSPVPTDTFGATWNNGTTVTLGGAALLLGSVAALPPVIPGASTDVRVMIMA